MECSFCSVHLYWFLISLFINILHPIMEAYLGNIPTISFCDTDSPMPYVDIGIPANNKGKNIIGCPFWMLARMVLQMRGTIHPGHKWDVMVDLFFYREPEEAKDQELDESGVSVPEYGVTEYGGAGTITNDQWGGDAQWAEEVVAAPALAGGADWTDARKERLFLEVCSMPTKEGIHRCSKAAYSRMLGASQRRHAMVYGE